jgi:hypothetical protein
MEKILITTRERKKTREHAHPKTTAPIATAIAESIDLDIMMDTTRIAK